MIDRATPSRVAQSDCRFARSLGAHLVVVANDRGGLCRQVKDAETYVHQ
jgi:hypothetical protein